jgi:hypothetical protein
VAHRVTDALVVAVVQLLSLGATSCERAPPVAATDTEGRSFKITCPPEKSCEVAADAPDRPAPTVLRATGRVVGVCPRVDDPSRFHPGDCRALVCARDAQCPHPEGARAGACIGGFCVDPSHPIGSEDAIMLCLAGTGFGHDSPLQVQRFALALSCGSPCRIPKPCRQL